MSDLRILLLIISIFFLVGVTLPFINDSFGEAGATSGQEINQTDLISSITEKEDENVKGTDVLKSVGLMFFWTFGALPVYLDLFFSILRILLVIVIYRQIRSGAG